MVEDNDKAEIEELKRQLEKLKQELGSAVGEFKDIPMDAPSSVWREALKAFSRRVSVALKDDKKKGGRG